MSEQRLRRPYRDSPYEYPDRHLALQASGQPTRNVIDERAQANFASCDLIDKIGEHGVEQLKNPGAMKVPPISERGNFGENSGFFGNVERLAGAVTALQRDLYRP